MTHGNDYNAVVEVSTAPITVEVVEEDIEIVVTEEIIQVEIGTFGPQGPPGPAGPAGSTTSVFYVHNQATPSATWTIDHNLGGHPTAVVQDSGGTTCEGNFAYPSINRLVITFSAAFSGVAYVI
jgi:hypothetical protein